MSLKVENIKFGYSKDRIILNDISFDLERSHSMGILGISGSGKSTLIRIITGLIASNPSNYYEGNISFDGQSSEKIRAQAKLSFMFQESSLLPDRNVFENVALPLRILNQFNHEKVNEMIDLVGLGDAVNKFPKDLSGGMKTRTALARSFITSPAYLFLDEPFVSLDLPKKTDLYNTLFDLTRKFNTSIIIVSHDIEEVVYLTNRICILSKTGRILDRISIEEKLPREFEYTEVVKKLSDKITYINNLIYLDSARGEATQKDFAKYMKFIKESVGTPEENSVLVEKSIDRLRKFTNDAAVNKELLSLWSSANKILKYKLVWDILNFEELSIDHHTRIFEFVFSNLVEFSELSFPFYKVEHSDLLHALYQRINDPEIPASKKWIYLCNLPAIKDTTDALPLLREIIETKNKNFVYPFAKHVSENLIKEFENVQV
jgi:ABC-type nitrate/sulfonate/bicarbonate transport system ATPase subunit